MSPSSRSPAPSSTPIVLIVAATLFVDMLLYGVVVPVLPGYVVRLGASASTVGLLFASYAIALLASTPILGWLVAKVGRRRPFLAGLFGLAAATTLFAVAHDIAWLLVARSLQGISAAASWTSGLALIADRVAPEKRGRAFGLSGTASALGTLLGPPLGGWLADAAGVPAPFLVIALMAAGTFLVAAGVLRQRGESRDVVRASHAALLADGEVRAIGAFIVLGSAILGLLEPTMPLHLADRFGASATLIGETFAVASLAYGVAAPAAGWLADRFGAAWPMRVGWVLSAVCLPMTLVPRDLLTELIVVTALGVALAIVLTPTLRALASAVDRAGGDYGIAYAFYNAAYAVGLLAGGALGGPAVDALGMKGSYIAVAWIVLLAGFRPARMLARARQKGVPSPRV